MLQIAAEIKNLSVVELPHLYDATLAQRRD